MTCTRCGSGAINLRLHGRDGTRPDLCEVCYWRTRAERLQAERDDARRAARLIANQAGGRDIVQKLADVWPWMA